MKKKIFGLLAAILFIGGTMSFSPNDQQQDSQQQKRTGQQIKDRNKDKDTMSNQRMHDYKTPRNTDSMPERVPPVIPLPDTINKSMH